MYLVCEIGLLHANHQLFHIVARRQHRLCACMPMTVKCTSVRLYACQRRCCRRCPSVCMHCRHQRLDEGQSSATEPIQDRGYVVEHQSAAGQDHHQKCAAVIDRCNSCRFSAQTWCLTVSCHWTHMLLLSAAAVTTSYDTFVQ